MIKSKATSFTEKKTELNYTIVELIYGRFLLLKK